MRKLDWLSGVSKEESHTKHLGFWGASLGACVPALGGEYADTDIARAVWFN